MMNLHGCPRCNGAVVEYGIPTLDSAMCVNCGWRRSEIPADIEATVKAHLGKPYLGDRSSHGRIGTGNPPPERMGQS